MRPSSRASRLISIARYRASKKGRECSLDVADIARRIEAGHCEATGIPFEPHGRWAATLDRIDSDLGYTPANTQVVCYAYNVMKNRWGDLTLMRVAESRRHFVQQPSERPNEDPDRRRGDGQLPGPDDQGLDDPAGRR